MSNSQILIYAGLVALGWLLKTKFGTPPPQEPKSASESTASPPLVAELVKLLKQTLQQGSPTNPTSGTPASIPVSVELHPTIKSGGNP